MPFTMGCTNSTAMHQPNSGLNVTASDISAAMMENYATACPDVEEILSNATPEYLSHHTKAGFLLKRSKFKHQWKRRYLVLKGNLFFSCHMQGEKPSGVMYIDKDTRITELATPELDEPSMKILSEKQNTMIIKDSKGEMWPLSHDSRAEFEKWLKTLGQVVADDQLLHEYKTRLLGILQGGAPFTKKNFSSIGAFSTRDQVRFVSLTTDCKAVIWHKKDKAEYDQIELADIVHVACGAETKVFTRRGNRSVDPSCCFSIITTTRSLDLVAESAEQRDIWVRALNAARRFGSILTEDQLYELSAIKRQRRAFENTQRKIEKRREASTRAELAKTIAQRG